MNYFGHAAIAGKWSGSDRGFVFGSMLPDLAHFVERSVSSEVLGEVGDGIRFHLRTDSIFHQNPRFDRWHHGALATLRARNISRGPARASAHVGIEMLIDDALARDAESRSAYGSALQFGAEHSRELFASFGAEVAEVCSTLLRFVGHLEDTSTERLELRLSRALANRPKLRPREEELAEIVLVLSEYRIPIEEEVGALTKDLLEALDHFRAT